jgi:hypothetical protein
MKQISEVKTPFLPTRQNKNNDHRVWKSNNVDNEIISGDAELRVASSVSETVSVSIVRNCVSAGITTTCGCNS